MGNDDEVLERLESQDWNDIIIKLTRYAYWRAARYKWRTGNPGQLPGGMTPQDIALNAIEKVWNRTRSWDPGKYPDLLVHLKWIVDSDTGHLAQSMEHTINQRITNSDDGKAGDPIPDNSSPLIDSLIPETPEEQLIAREMGEYEEKVKKELYALVKGDEDLELLLSCLEDGIDKAELVAKEMRWDVTKVYNLKRKLSRKASAIIKIMEQE